MQAFECKMCGTCCYGEGGILVDDREIERIAGFLSISGESFVRDYCEKRNGRLYIRTGEDGFCVFFHKEKQCLIHPVNPRPCSLWPFYPGILADPDNWEEAKDACPGINPDCTFEEFRKQAKESI